MGNGLPHIPVLYNEIIHALQPHRGGLYVDGTVGAGGHAEGILEASSPDGRLVGLDLDPFALALAQKRLAPYADRVHLIQANYASLPEQMAAVGWKSADGILLDLGISSMQLEAPERGFSFLHDAPLDMRFNPESRPTAAELVNSLPEKDLADLLYRYGEERQARAIARAIVQARPVLTTRQLAGLISRVIIGGKKISHRHSPIDPATRTFQALRIAVNGELDALETVLPEAVAALAPGGRLAVISFHSLEDRIVKQFMHQESRGCICPPKQPACTCGHKASIREITRHPIRPLDIEVEQNPRSRSARLRVAEKLELTS